MTVRRHEMLTQKAKERAALERAAVGRLTATNAEVLFVGEQRQSEANALRAQVDGLQQRVEALEEARLELEQDNAALREALAQAKADVQPLSGAGLDDGSGDRTSTSDTREDAAPEPEQARITAATTALLALARDYRRERAPAPAISSDEARPVEANGPTGPGEGVAELMEIARAPAPADPRERKLRNANVRERIAELASRFLPGESPATATAERSPEVSTPAIAKTEPSAPDPRKSSSGPRPKRRRGSQRNRSQTPR